ncbi:protease-4 [Chromohalobacter marismortui]|uniref:Protease-4 n=1 Tax=Chromohalobacter marismortui TaxID=42055 RepID=A0A4R7NV61_9GAMM|nr:MULTISPECIES: signal peptide peptidase SppA [Chromohalobacter]MCI0510379.1 signal peptide peptidase SppA [Chromohalobacter sp.]MCI0594736.1 signal peptide peptidase SppA [Chromohalobacter sp.]TDU25045.1 protease-4 [Chromohalobacter marismortui]
MSDDKHGDAWTQGPEVERASRGRERAEERDEASISDPERLRELRRLREQRMLDRWIDGVLVEQRRSRRWKLFFRLVLVLLVATSLAMTAYALFFAGRDMPGGVGAPHVGVVEINGVIDANGEANAERIIEGLRAAWQAPASRAVVLHVNSPGGSPVQSQRVYDEVQRLTKKGDKPIVAVIEDIGASGAYYIAAAADDIYAAPASLVGSIGVIYSGFGMQGAIDKLGIERRVFTAGDNKAFLDPFSPIRDEQRKFWQQVLDTTHRQFIEDVKRGRGERLADDPRLFSGLIWTGEQALGLGLIDGLSSIDALSRERFGGVPRRDYTPALDPLSRLSRQLGRVAAEWAGVSSNASPVRYQVQ